jgi:hypothetical protein
MGAGLITAAGVLALRGRGRGAVVLRVRWMRLRDTLLLPRGAIRGQGALPDA